jgi:hypothetical protein
MTEKSFQVVQFIHPGFEYPRSKVGPRSSGVMAWKPGRSPHNRKFMLSMGSLVDWTEGRDHRSVPLMFWGEWEGPSVYWRVESPGKPLPKIVHAPFRPAHWPNAPVQNTDPMVFGDAFVYSNCLQRTYRRLRTLDPGSIVLFGRYGREGRLPSFSLDTCLVVDRIDTAMPIANPDGYGTDLLSDAVLGPLQTEGAELELSVYFGRRYSGSKAEPFSFFPAKLVLDSTPLFPRPELRPNGALDGVVSPGNMQGIKITANLSAIQRDEIWHEVAGQVSEQGCQLAYHATAPPLLESQAAESAARLSPRPLTL